MARSALILARYKLATDNRALSLREQIDLLAVLKDAQPISYRTSEPTDENRDTYVIGPKSGTRYGENYLTWQVCRDISYRQVRRPDRKSQTVEVDFENTDDCELARIVAIPRLGVLAVEDGTGEGQLGGWPALRRFAAIVDEHSLAEFEAEPAGTPQDLKKAIDTWDLEKFSFQARPFNPHPSNPGQILSDMLQADGVGELRAIAITREGANIKPKEDGIVQEAIGLADKGYATYGMTGRTPSGAEAIVKKPPFSHNRNKNMESLRGPQQLRVYIEADKEDARIAKIVDVLVEFFEPETKIKG